MPGTSDSQQDPSASLKGRYLLRLYVADNAPNSVRAMSNLQAIYDEHLAGRRELEVVDVLQEPQRALDDNVLVTPTLVKLSPLPEVKIVGNLSDKARVLSALGVKEA